MFRRGRGGRGMGRGRNSNNSSNSNSGNNNSQNNNGSNPDDNPNNNGSSTTTQMTEMSSKILGSIWLVIIIIISNCVFIGVFAYYLFGVETNVECYAVEGS